MGTLLRNARRLLLFTAFGLAALTRGAALPAAEFEDEAAPPAKKYTATACLLVERHEPHVLRQRPKRRPGEFEKLSGPRGKCNSSNRSCVIMAALRDPQGQRAASIKREEERHHAVAWLEKEIRVKCPRRAGGQLSRSALPAAIARRLPCWSMPWSRPT